MDLDYVREQIADKDIDVPFARHTLVKQAALDLKPVTERRPVSGLLYGCWLGLMSEPHPERVQQIVNDLCVVLNESLLNAEEVTLPGSFESPGMAPSAEHPLATAAQHYVVVAAILEALDCLGWVLAYDQIQPFVPEDE